MSDITMCTNSVCPKRGECYRYLAVPDKHRQSYSLFLLDEDRECDAFWRIEAGDKVRELEEVDDEQL